MGALDKRGIFPPAPVDSSAVLLWRLNMTGAIGWKGLRKDKSADEILIKITDS